MSLSHILWSDNLAFCYVLFGSRRIFSSSVKIVQPYKNQL